MKTVLNFKCGSVKHIQTWGKELKEYLILFLTSLDNQNYCACLEKSLLPEFFREKFDNSLQSIKETSSDPILEHTANQSPQCQPQCAIFSELSLNMGSCIHKSPSKKTHTWEQHWQWHSSDKQNKSTSLRNSDCFEAWKRKQEHHLWVPLVSQVEANHSVEIQLYIHSGCRQLEI